MGERHSNPDKGECHARPSFSVHLNASKACCSFNEEHSKRQSQVGAIARALTCRWLRGDDERPLQFHGGQTLPSD